MGPFLGALTLFETATIAAIEARRYFKSKQPGSEFGSQAPLLDMIHKSLHKTRTQS